MLNANHAALFFTVAMLAVTTYFLLGSIPLLILKHDNTMDAKMGLIHAEGMSAFW